MYKIAAIFFYHILLIVGVWNLSSWYYAGLYPVHTDDSVAVMDSEFLDAN